MPLDDRLTAPQPVDPALAWLESVTPEQRMTLYRLYMRAAELGAQAETREKQEANEEEVVSDSDGASGGAVGSIGHASK